MTVSAPPNVLTPEHRHQLEVESAILPEIIAEEDIRSLPSSLDLPTPDPTLRHPNSHKGEFFGIWGETDDTWRPIDLGPGIWFRTRDAAGRLSGQYKPDRPRTAFNGHTVKYETCRGTRPSFAVPTRCLPLLLRSKCEVYFVEGYKKALAIASAGGCAVSLAGVYAWLTKAEPNGPSEPIEDFDAVDWHGRLVFITYDSDAVLKDGVRYAERRIKQELESRGAIVVVLRIPHAADGSKRGVDDYLRDRLAAGVTRADALCELKSVAIAELLRLSKLPRQPATGTDGEQHCRCCTENAEQLREHKLADQMKRSKAFSPGEVDVARYYSQQAAVAIAQGKSEMPVWSEETERFTGASPATATRLHKAYKQFQDDPAIGPTLSWHLRKDTDSDGKDHYRVVVAKIPEEPAERTTVAMLAPLARLRRPKDRAAHGGARDACPKCQSPLGMARTTQDVCQNDECGHVVTHPTKYIGRAPFHDETAPPPEKIGGDFYAVQVQAPRPFHDEIKRERTYSKQDETVSRKPLSFVSRDDAELAAGPTYQGDPDADAPPQPPPPPQPLPIAPRRHLAWSPRRHDPLPAAVSGGET
jgi:hypothetical protein